MTPSAPVPADKRDRLATATYTVAQLADLLNCSERHVHRLRDQKAIPGELRVGRCVRFGRAIIDRWLSGSTIPSTH